MQPFESTFFYSYNYRMSVARQGVVPWLFDGCPSRPDDTLESLSFLGASQGIFRGMVENRSFTPASIPLFVKNAAMVGILSLVPGPLQLVRWGTWWTGVPRGITISYRGVDFRRRGTMMIKKVWQWWYFVTGSAVMA